MSNDFSPIDPPDTETSMFAGVPSWERGKKRRGFGSRGSRVAAEPRSFAPEYAPEPGDPIPTRPATLSDDARAYEARMGTVDPTDASFAAGPIYATRTARRNNGAAPIAILAGVILLGGLAAAGWYATQSHTTGVAELTPGAAATTTTTQVASAAPTPAEPQAADIATQPPAPAPATTHHATTVTTTTHVPKGAVSHTTVTRAAPARSAGDVSANASATAAPTPAPAAPPAAAPPAPLVLSVPPAQAAPPTPAPETPQTAPAPPPTQTPPTQTPPN